MITIDNIRQHDGDNDCDINVRDANQVILKTYPKRGPNGILDGHILMLKLGFEE